jgi:hypothetical protein
MNIQKKLMAAAGLAVLALATYTLVGPLRADANTYYCCDNDSQCGGSGSGYTCVNQGGIDCQDTVNHYGAGSMFCSGNGPGGQ